MSNIRRAWINQPSTLKPLHNLNGVSVLVVDSGEEVVRGDTVIHNGKEMTVGNNNITHCTFMGRALFGDTYKSGTKPVVRVEIQRALPQK